MRNVFLFIDLKQIKITSLTNNYPQKAIQPPIDGPFFVCYGLRKVFLFIELKQIKITSLTNNYPKKAIQPPIDGPFFVCYGLSYTIAALMAHGLQRMAKVMGPIGSHRFLCGAWVHGDPIDGPFFRMLYVGACSSLVLAIN